MKLLLCVFLTLKLVSAQCGQHFQYQWAPQEQNVQQSYPQYTQQENYYEQQQYDQQQNEDEPHLGSPLISPIGLKLSNPFGLFGVPGLRFNNLNMGRLGSLAFSNSILGAQNPNAEENNFANQQQVDYQVGLSPQQHQYPADYTQQQVDSQVGAAQENQGLHHHHWWFINDQNEQQLGSPQQYQQEYQQNYEQYQPQLQSNQYNYQAPPQYNYQQQQLPIVTPQHLQNDDVQATADERSPWWGGNNYKKIVIEKGNNYPAHHQVHHDYHHHDYHNSYYQPYYSKTFSKTYSKGYAQPEYHAHHKPTLSYGYSPSYGYSSLAASLPSSSSNNDVSSSNTEVTTKSEVAKTTTEKHKELKITTTYAPSTITAKTTKFMTTTQTSTTEESIDETSTTNQPATIRSTSEKSEKKEKPKSNSLLELFNVNSRKRRSVLPNSQFSIPNKRCINFGKSIFYDTLLGTSNPNINDDVSARSDQEVDESENHERYETTPALTKFKKSLFSTNKIQLNDNLPQESIFNSLPFNRVQLTGDLLNKVSLPSRTESLLNGNILGNSNSNSESNEPVNDGADSMQIASDDEVVSAVNIGATSFITNPLYDRDLPLNTFDDKLDSFKKPINRLQPQYLPPPVNSKPSSCNCNREHVDNLLSRIHTSYNKFNHEVRGIIDDFKSETNCGRSADDSFSSPSQKPEIDYNVLCRDAYSLNTNPDLALKCQNLYSSSNRDGINGIYYPPGSQRIETYQNPYKGQFLSYDDYVKMITNPNNRIDPTIVAATSSLDNDENSNTVKSFKAYVKEFKEPEPIVAVEQPEEKSTKPKQIPARRIKIISPEDTVAFLDRVSKPYLGMLNAGNEKLWDNGGIVGRFIGPLEDTYLEIVKQNEYEPQIQAIRVIT
ncbi:hypothetical protein PVAND_010130 [Polypedilum vanderplanki]|uniref:Uncharacterized protein n=1 Tax=Polypedilum vanderplanki TaxID=319348 RepID=A0A9J6CEX5_POLVA|nr:hypothetical protein PVAND_010130 [Polypedilum vanderplanki]